MRAICKAYVSLSWHKGCDKIFGNSLEYDGCIGQLPGNSICVEGQILFDHIDYIKYKKQFNEFFSFEDIIDE